MSSADSSSEERSSKIQRTKIDPKQLVCFLCEKEAQVSELRQAMTMQLDHRLNECAHNLNNGRLLAILSGGDVVAQELKYHPACLAGLYNQERAHLKTLEHEEGNERSPSREAYPLAFSELVTYITEAKTSSADISPSIFKLADLASLYKQRLEQLGVVSPDVNSTRLKEKLPREMPELEAYQKGRNVLLAFHKDVGSTLSQACEYTEAIILAKAAKIIRRNMLDHKSKFDGQFHEGCVEEAIPPTLLQFVSMIEYGADIKSQLRFGACKTDVAMAHCFSTTAIPGTRKVQKLSDIQRIVRHHSQYT